MEPPQSQHSRRATHETRPTSTNCSPAPADNLLADSREPLVSYRRIVGRSPIAAAAPLNARGSKENQAPVVGRNTE